MDVFKIATLNINGLASRTKVEMLEDFLRRQEIDILFLQEVAHSTIQPLRSYKTYTNVGTVGRGTAMVRRNEITITNITRLPSG
jgi:exonuclease III